MPASGMTRLCTQWERNLSSSPACQPISKFRDGLANRDTAGTLCVVARAWCAVAVVVDGCRSQARRCGPQPVPSGVDTCHPELRSPGGHTLELERSQRRRRSMPTVKVCLPEPDVARCHRTGSTLKALCCDRHTRMLLQYRLQSGPNPADSGDLAAHLTLLRWTKRCSWWKPAGEYAVFILFSDV